MAPVCWKLIYGALVFALCSVSYQANALDISGSSTVQPVVQKLSPLFTGESVNLTGGGSGVGVKNAIEGKSDIGMVSRDLKDDEKAALKNTVIANDALAIIVNKANPLTNLTKSQLIDIYSGKVNNWSALGGPNQPIRAVTKEVGRSTLELFEHYTGLLAPESKKSGKPLITGKAAITGSSLETVTLVGGLPGGIGYVSVGTALSMIKAGMPAKLVALDGVEASEESIKSKRYPIVRPLNLAYAKETPAVRHFLDLALSAQGQEVVKSLGFLPVGK